jgi:hypothetical protein
LVGTSACAIQADGPTAIVDAAIERHGGGLFEDSRIRFDFRGTRFEFFRDAGVFRYERVYRDPLGRTVSDVMDNDGTHMFVNGGEVALTPEERESVEYDVNSVIYFAFLPFRLRDPAARIGALDPDTIRGEPYHRVEVTFTEEGGGVDSDARFVHWIHADSLTLDYFAYRYSRDGGGARFRRAVNRREIGGILVQDFENYAPAGPVEDVAELSRHFEDGTLDLLSLVALEGLEVTRAGESASAAADPLLPPEAPGEGLELQLGIERLEYGPGDSIRVVVNLVNRTAEQRTLTFSSAQRVDLLVLEEDGEPQSRWSEGQLFAQVVGEERLSPGETREFEAFVSAPPTPGSYFLQGSVSASGAPLPAVLPFRVVP